MRLCSAACRAEAIDSETALLRGDCDKLRAAAGLVYGSVLSSALWSVIGLLAWRAIA